MDHNMGKSLIDFNTFIFFYSTSSFFWPLFFTAYQLKSMCARASIHGAVDGSRHSAYVVTARKRGRNVKRSVTMFASAHDPASNPYIHTHTHTLYVYVECL